MAPSAIRSANGPSGAGRSWLASRAGVATVPMSGTATRLASGETGERSWKHHATVGSVPAVAPSVVASPVTGQRSHHRASGGSQRVTRGMTSTIPASAPKESWQPAFATAPGSAREVPSHASDSTSQGPGRRRRAPSTAPAAVIHTARRAGRGQPARSA
jgi:hypothetical protein